MELLATKVAPGRSQLPPPHDFVKDFREVRRHAIQMWWAMTDGERLMAVNGEPPFWAECEIRRDIGRVVWGFNEHVCRAFRQIGRL